MQACFTQKLCQRELCYGHVRDAITYSACKKLVRAIPFDVLLGDNIDNGYRKVCILNSGLWRLFKPVVTCLWGSRLLVRT